MNEINMIDFDGILINDLYLRSHKEMKEILESRLFEGLPFVVTGYGSDLEPGESYLAQRRNISVVLLTCKENNKERGWIFPQEKLGYPYDTGECIRIKFTI